MSLRTSANASRRPLLVAVVAAGGLIAADPASAATPTVVPAGAPAPVAVEQPLQTLVDTAAVLTGTGEGHVAWVVQPIVVGGGDDTPIAVWTVKDGTPTQVASLPSDTPSSPEQLEVGRAADGTPVAFVKSRARRGSVLRLVRLDTGAVRTVSSTRGGRTIGGVGIDDGRYYYTAGPARTTARSTASLWRATIRGLSIGHATKLRSSRRGEGYDAVVADRGRVAVKATQPIDDGSGAFRREEWAFGTPRGTWRRAGLTTATDGGYAPITAAFTQDRTALITVQTSEAANSMRVVRTPLGDGRPTTITTTGPGDSQDYFVLPSYDPLTGRLLTRGIDASGALTVGYTRVVVR